MYASPCVMLETGILKRSAKLLIHPTMKKRWEFVTNLLNISVTGWRLQNSILLLSERFFWLLGNKLVGDQKMSSIIIFGLWTGWPDLFRFNFHFASICKLTKLRKFTWKHEKLEKSKACRVGKATDGNHWNLDWSNLIIQQEYFLVQVNRSNFPRVAFIMHFLSSRNVRNVI